MNNKKERNLNNKIQCMVLITIISFAVFAVTGCPSNLVPSNVVFNHVTLNGYPAFATLEITVPPGSYYYYTTEMDQNGRPVMVQHQLTTNAETKLECVTDAKGSVTLDLPVGVDSAAIHIRIKSVPGSESGLDPSTGGSSGSSGGSSGDSSSSGSGGDSTSGGSSEGSSSGGSSGDSSSGGSSDDSSSGN